MRNAPTFKMPAMPLPYVAWYWRIICFFAIFAPVAGMAFWED